MPLLSLIVTAYNIEEFLDECLQTVVGQTLTDMEIIVVDDGSSDGTAEIIRKYAAEESRVRPIFLPTNTIGGVASAANAGLDAATGKYIGFVDGDDYLEPTMFEELCTAAETYGSDLAMCRYMEAVGPEKELKEPAERLRWVGFSETRHVPLDTEKNTKTVLRFIAVPWRKIYSRRLIEDNKIRFPVVDYYWEDNPFHWFTVCSAASIVLVPKVLCYHRVDRPGQTMSMRNAGLMKMFGHYETIRAWLEARGMLASYHAPLVGWAISQYQWIHKRIPEDAGGDLFDVMAGIVGPLDETVFSQAMAGKGQATEKQLRNMRAGDRDAFLKYFAAQFRARRGLSAVLHRHLGRPVSLLRLGLEHLRDNGMRSTLSKTSQVLFGDRFGKAASPRQNGPLTEERMLQFLTLLQRDMERKHAEQMARLKALEDRVEELSGDGDVR